MNALASIKIEDLRDYLARGWLTHDGMWFYNTAMKLGIREANELNLAAIRSMAALEVNRTRKLLGGTFRMEGLDDVMGYFNASLQLVLPSSVFSRFKMIPVPPATFRWSWEKGECFAFKGISQAGLIEGYRCGVIYRIECWLQALGVGYRLSPSIGGCLMHEKGSCEGEFTFDFPAASR